MRELPLNSQIEKVKNVINRLMEIYQDNQFSTEDIIHPPFRHLVGFNAVNVSKVIKYLFEIGEVEIIGQENNKIEFRVTEKFGEIPYIKIDVPVTNHIIKSLIMIYQK